MNIISSTWPGGETGSNEEPIETRKLRAEAYKVFNALTYKAPAVWFHQCELREGAERHAVALTANRSREDLFPSE